jgi:hypothetical protein
MKRQYVNVRVDADQAEYLKMFGNLTKAVRDGLRSYLKSIGADPYITQMRANRTAGCTHKRVRHARKSA